MSADPITERKVWEAEHARQKLWRRRMWFWFAMLSAGVVALMIAGFAAPATWVDIFAAASTLVLFVWSGTLIAAIGLGVSERSARRRMVELDKRVEDAGIRA